MVGANRKGFNGGFDTKITELETVYGVLSLLIHNSNVYGEWLDPINSFQLCQIQTPNPPLNDLLLAPTILGTNYSQSLSNIVNKWYSFGFVCEVISIPIYNLIYDPFRVIPVYGNRYDFIHNSAFIINYCQI